MTSLQRDILRRHGLASICALLFNLLFILSYHWQSPDPRPDALYGMSLVYWLVQLAMLYWLVDGRSRHYRDPSMTLIFLAWGITFISASLAVAPENHTLVLMTYLTIMPYGIFRLTWKGFVLLALYTVVTYCLVMLLLHWQQPHHWSWSTELLLAMTLLLSLLTYAVLGREVAVLRAAYRRKNQELRRAMQRIEELAVTDELTGLYNRRYLLQMLEQQQALANREALPFALAFIDIDHFKPINDQYGHSAGDQVLAELAQLLRKSVRQVDVVARYGGEEFVLLLNGQTLEAARHSLQRVCQQIRSQRFSAWNLPLTVSVGVTEYSNGENAESMLNRADMLLYEAKGNGRNRIVAGLAPVQLPLDEPSEREGMACSTEAAGTVFQSS